MACVSRHCERPVQTGSIRPWHLRVGHPFSKPLCGPQIPIGPRPEHVQRLAPRFPPSRLVRHLPSGRRRASLAPVSGQVSHNPKQLRMFPDAGRTHAVRPIVLKNSESAPSRARFRPRSPRRGAGCSAGPASMEISSETPCVGPDGHRCRGLVRPGTTGMGLIVLKNSDGRSESNAVVAWLNASHLRVERRSRSA